MSRHYLPPAHKGTLPNSGNETQHCAVCNKRMRNERQGRDQRLCGPCNRDADAYQQRPFLLYGQFPKLENYLRKRRP